MPSLELTNLLTLLTTVLTGGAGVWLATEAAKRIKAIPVSEGQTARIRAVAAVLSVLAVCLEGLASGNLAPDNLQQLAVAVLTAAATFSAAHTAHKLRKVIKP